MAKPQIDWKRPNELSGIISQSGYEQILQFSLEHVHGKAIVKEVENGTMHLALGDIQDLQCALHNLVRLCAGKPTSEWKGFVIQHFGRLWLSLAEQDEADNLIRDFNKARPLLRLRVYPDNFSQPSLRDQLVKREDFPLTFTNLVLDHEDRFQLLTESMIAPWGIPKKELYAIAQEQVNLEDTDVSQMQLQDGKDIFLFTAGDFAVSCLLDFESNAAFAKGKYGSLVAIPSKSAAICVPIEGPEIMGYLQLLAPLVIQFYAQDPGNINTCFYWYHDRRFELFPLGEGSKVVLPKGLAARFATGV